MRIREIEIKNYRSIAHVGPLRVTPILSIVGENNCGKSNTMAAVRAFLTGGAGATIEDFKDPACPIVIKITFQELSAAERARWKKYCVGDYLILEKHIVATFSDSETYKISSEYHGYIGEPANPLLSIEKIHQNHGTRPDWTSLVQEGSLPDYFLQDGKSNKSIYSKALDRYLEENDVDLTAPDLSSTQALGLQSNVIASLPNYYLLPAITDYSSEIDKRQKSSTFRRLMAELSDRILRLDPRYAEVTKALETIRALLNPVSDTTSEATVRLDALSKIEEDIASSLKQVMPSVNSIGLRVQIEELKALFSDGVEISIDDGVSTDVMAKGHGLQRTIVFALLRTLIELRRRNPDASLGDSSIVLAIEEPELYVHPQVARLFYDVLRSFSETDQVLFTTHSPNFIDASNYEEICIASKVNSSEGTKVKHANGDAFSSLDERKLFKGFSRFNSHINEMFFAKRVIVVEGPEDAMAVTAVLTKHGKIQRRVEEIECTVLVAGGKEAIPFFQRVLNCFDIPYSVLYDTDITEGMNVAVQEGHDRTNETIRELAGTNFCHTFTPKLETCLRVSEHFKDQFKAHQFFSDMNNLTPEVESVILELIG